MTSGPETEIATSALAAAVGRPGGDPSLRCLALLHAGIASGRFDAVATVARLARERGVAEERLEEAALQAAVFAGHPRAIQGLGVLARERAEPSRAAARAPAGPRPAAGRAVWDRVYGDAAGPVLEVLEGLAEGFSEWVLEDAYGRVLARDGLALVERELLAVAALAVLALPRPLEAHVRGARRNGADATQVEDILQTCRVLADPRAREAIGSVLDRLHREAPRA